METESEKISEPRREWDLTMGKLWMQKASDTMHLRCNSIGPALNLWQKVSGLSVQWGSHFPWLGHRSKTDSPPLSAQTKWRDEKGPYFVPNSQHHVDKPSRGGPAEAASM